MTSTVLPARIPHGEADTAASDVRKHASWSPYDMNGGTVLAVAGDDYCIVAGSTRLSTSYSILTRDQSKLCQLSPHCVIASGGFQADMRTLNKHLQAKAVMFQHNHRKPISCPAMAQLLANTLYYKRFFPYYAFTLCAGLDAEGKGAVYAYDAVGSYERYNCACQGSGKDLIQPVLDKQLQERNPLVFPAVADVKMLDLDKALDLVKDAFTAAGERDIYTGDKVEIWVIKKEGIEKHELELKKD